MSLAELVKLVPPPKKPKEVGPASRWQQAEKELGVTLPGDYKEFVETYGSGLFAGFYFVHSPYAKSPYTNLGQSVASIAEDLHSRGDDVPFAIHPARPGLLLWGHDENGNYYYWLTKGDPDKWTVVTDNSRGDGFAQHKCTLVQYLLRVQQIKIRPLASGYPPLVMRCPCEGCAGQAQGSHDLSAAWHCEDCGYDWDDRESFEDDVTAILKARPHRRVCYQKKRGHYYPAPAENEPKNYKKLVRAELDD